MKEITVDFKTITPLWTGDAWGNNSEIKPSAIMGSLRNYFNDYCKEKNIPLTKLDNNGKLDEKLDYEKFRQCLIKNRYIKKCLHSQNISLESQIFGCTGWKSRVLIKNIETNGRVLNKIIFEIDLIYLKEFEDFLVWMEERNIYIGKGHKKKRGGKVKIIKNKKENIKSKIEKLDISKLQEKWS